VAAEKNSTLVLPFPVELLRFLEHHTGPSDAPAKPAPVEPKEEPPEIPAQDRAALDTPPAPNGALPAGEGGHADSAHGA
jgi:hypothetical protein